MNNPRKNQIHASPEERQAYGIEDVNQKLGQTNQAIESLHETTKIHAQGTENLSSKLEELSNVSRGNNPQGVVAKLDEVKGENVSANEKLANLEKQTSENTDLMKQMLRSMKEKSIPVELIGMEQVVIQGEDGAKGEKGDKGDPGKDGYTPVLGVDYFDGKDGKDGRDGTDAKFIGPRGEKGEDGKPGKDGKDGVDGKDGENGSPDTPEEIISKIQNKFSYNLLADLPKLYDPSYNPQGSGGGTNGVLFYSEGNLVSEYVTRLNFDNTIDATYNGNGEIILSSNGGGVNEFIDLIDAPSTYAGSAGFFVRVNDTETALEFFNSSVSVDWGQISGTLSNQTDLQAALDDKQNSLTTGTALQYFAGDLSLITFPTTVSTFTNDSGYITNATGLISAGSNVTITGTGTSGSPYVINSSGGGGGTPGGSTTQVQYNNAGAFGGITGATTNGVTLTLVAPILGTPTSVTLTNATGLPLTTGVTGILPSVNGGTGVNNGGATVTLGGNLTISGAFNTTFTVTNNTNVTFPTTGTLVNTAVATLSSLTSAASLNTIGTITTGVWNGTDIAVADGGTGASTASGARTNLGLVIGTDVQIYSAGLTQIGALADPNADRILFWDDSAGAYTYLTAGTGLSISGTTITATGAVTSVTANNSSLTISPTTGAVLAEVNLANNFAWTGSNTYSNTQTFNGTAAFTGAVTFTNLPTSSATPSAGNEFTTVTYVSALVAGLSTPAKGACRLGTTAALPTNTYANGASGVGATLTATANGALSIDGTLTVAGDRVLIKDEVTQANNGIYTVTTVGTGGTPYVLTRATDFDQSADVSQGSFTFVTSGTATPTGNLGTQWIVNSVSTPTMGTTAITFAQFNSSTVYSASLGVQLVGSDFRADLSASGAITLTGNSMQVAVDGSSIEINTNALRVKALGITNAMLAGSIADTKLSTITTAGKVSGAALTSLSSIPSGAGIIPVANLASGTPTASTFPNGLGVWTDLSGIYVSAITSSDSSITVSGAGTVDLILDMTHTNAWSAPQFFASITQTNASYVMDGASTFSIDNSNSSILFTGGVSFATYAIHQHQAAFGTDIYWGTDDGTTTRFWLAGDFANNVSMRLAFATGNNTDYVSLRAPVSVAANVEWTLPNADAAGVWQSNGSGVLSIGNIAATSGGTGFSSYTVGDMLQANTTTTLAKLPAVATGNVILSGGVGVVSAWGKVGLTTHVSGTLPIANGGTALTALGSALQYVRVNAGGTALEYATATGTGDVVGPASATDNAVARFDSTTGKLIQDSIFYVSDLQGGNQLTLSTSTSVGLLVFSPSGEGGTFSLSGGTKTTAGGSGGTITIAGGTGVGTNSGGGNVVLRAGAPAGSGAAGTIQISNTAGTFVSTIATTTLTANRVHTLPNASGTFAVSASGNVALSATGNITFTGTLPIANGGTNATSYGANRLIFMNSGNTAFSSSASLIYVAPKLTLTAATTAGASLNFPAGTSPTSPVEGDVWNDSTQKAEITYLAGLKGVTDRTIFTSTANSATITSGTETTVMGTGVGTLTLPANYLVAGRKIRIRVFIGSVSTSATPGDVALRAKFGATTVLTTTFTPPINQSGAGIIYEFEMTCRTVGGTGTVSAFARADFYGTVLSNYASNNSSVTVDTTAISALDVTLDWVTAGVNSATGLDTIIQSFN